MKNRITKTFVDKVSTPNLKDGKATQGFYRDSAIPGFGLRVTSGGVKSFIVEKRVNGKVKRITLGRYPDITVEQAKKLAQKTLGEIAHGKDPAAEKKAKRVKKTTLQEAFDDYLLTKKNLKASTIHDYHRLMNDPLADWKNKALVDITKDMVEIRHREFGKRSGARANNAMRVLRAIFNHAMAKYDDAQGRRIILFNPVDRLNETRAWFKIKPRQTYIKPSQLPEWYNATLQLRAHTTRDYLHLLLFTGLRRSEASGLKWSDIDFKEKTLTVHETKNHESHTLPFTDFLESLLKQRYKNKVNDFVFPSDSVRGCLKEPKTAIQRVCNISGVQFSLHDLRRTFITYADSLDIPGYALKRLLNHKNPNDVTARYIMADIDRLRVPMQKTTDFILNAIHADDK